jgi:peptidoglycan/xylan/chitin deacetylase (PgdA/CDA1 family)
MYHGVRNEKKQVGLHPYYELNVDPATFRAQMYFLSSEGYRVIPLADIDKSLDGKHSFGGKTVVLTFDDGYMDFFQNAFPILEEKGFPATVFLATGLVGKESDGVSYLHWDQIRELSSRGIAFGSHTVNHPKLHDMAMSEIESEIRNSRKEIEERTGIPVDTFAYPLAFPQEDAVFIRRLGSVLNKCGIRFGVTTVIGRVTKNHAPLFLKRIPVNSYDDIQLFRAKLEGAYDWLQVVQYASRRITDWKRNIARN